MIGIHAKNSGSAVKRKVDNRLLWISLGLFAGLVAIYFIFPGFKHSIDQAYDILTSNDQSRIKTWVKQYGALGPIILLVVMTLQIFLLIIPNLLLFIIAILCYGPIWGILICLTGVFISSSLGFFIGKRLGTGAIDRFVSKKTQRKISFFVKNYGFKAITIARLSSMGSDALGFVAGALEMTYKKFMAATIAGVVPVIVLIAIFGKNGKLEKGLLIIAGISLTILIVHIILDQKRRKSELHENTSEDG